MSDKLIIFDTTLRDGEQSPGASMTKDEKLRIARQLERMRVDVIEGDGAVRLDDEDVSIPLQSGHVSRVEFGDETIDRCGEDVAHRVAETSLLGDFALNVRPVLEHDDVVVGWCHCPHLRRNE